MNVLTRDASRGTARSLAGAPGLWVGLAALALGGLMVSQSWGRPFFVPGRGSGAMAFPLVDGWSLLLMGLLLTARTLVGRDGRSPVSWPAGDGRRRMLGLVALSFAYVALLSWAGFLVTNLVVGVACLRLLGGYHWWRAAALAIVMAVGLTLIFEYALAVSLPRGLGSP